MKRVMHPEKGRGMVSVLLSMAIVASAHAVERRNLITNFDHREGMGIDLPMGWVKHIKDKVTTKIDVAPQADGSVRFIATGDPWALYEQRNLKLVPGGKYRLSYEVKTDGLDGASVGIFLHDSKWSWKDPQKGPKFPDDTKGAWVKQEAVVTMCDNPGATMHTLSIGCIHGQSARKVDFFLRDLRLEAIDEATDRASAPIDAKSREKLAARIVPVDPLLANVNANDAQITFYWPGWVTGGVSRCHVVSRFKGKNYSKPVPAQFDEKGYATVRYGRVRPGRYEIEAEVIDDATNSLARNEYAITVMRPVKALTVGKRLNNFVTALVDQPLENGEVAFSRATPGWVWMSFEGDVGGEAVGYLDDIAYPVVRYRDGESRIEAQRFVTAGAHTLRISGAKPGGRLRINAVKTIWGKLPGMTTAPSACYRIGFRYTLPFCIRFGIHTHMNTSTFRLKEREHVNPIYAGYGYERGMRMFANVRISPKGPVNDDYEATWKALTEGPWTDGFSISVDENLVDQNQTPWRTVNYSEATWKMVALRPEQSINLFYAGAARGTWFDCPVLSASEIAATVNSGNGTGLLCPELYASVRETPEQLDRVLDAYAKFVTSANEMVPASKGKIVMYGASYVQIGDWSNYVAPATDIKAHYAKMYRAFATDPRFEGCAGVGCGGMICGGEELLRWMAKCVRYYALEGGTGDPASEYGFTWAPGFVKNADMDEGLTNWTAKGEIAAERLKNYGSRVQKRQAIPNGYGDGVAVFTTRPDRPNELSQDISGLQPGKLYALLFCVADRDDVLAKDGKTRFLKSPLAFSARLEGATELEDLRYETVSAVKTKVGLRLLRYVFRADSEKARLVFTDRKDDGSAAPEGFQQVLNYVSFMPYYVESADDPADIAAALGWKGPNRIRNGK
ncbi:MAG: hypothetical protein J6N18_09980 [Kiritimatiellae bacterium]|nr:hypothetical protein [Kiritimatiellia bacterium]